MQHRDKTILIKIISEINVALDMINGIPFADFDSNEMMKRVPDGRASNR